MQVAGQAELRLGPNQSHLPKGAMPQGTATATSITAKKGGMNRRAATPARVVGRDLAIAVVR